MSSIFGKTKKPVIRTERVAAPPSSSQPKNAFVAEQQARKAKFAALAAETAARGRKKKYSETATKRELESAVRRSKTKVGGAGTSTSTYTGTAFLGAPRAPSRRLGAAALAVSQGLVPSFAAPTAASKAKIAVGPTTITEKKSVAKTQTDHKKKTGFASNITTAGKSSTEAKKIVSEKSSLEAHKKKSSVEAKTHVSSLASGKSPFEAHKKSSIGAKNEIDSSSNSDLSTINTSDLDDDEPLARHNKRKASALSASRSASGASLVQDSTSDTENDEPRPPRPTKRVRVMSPVPAIVEQERSTQEIARKNKSKTSGKSISRAMAPTISSLNKVIRKTTTTNNTNIRPAKSTVQTSSATTAQSQRKIKTPKAGRQVRREASQPITISQSVRQLREDTEAAIAASLAELEKGGKRSRDDEQEEEREVKRQRLVIPGLEHLNDDDFE